MSRCLKLAAGLTSALVLLALPAYADGDAAAGARVFKKCQACHMIGEGAKNKLGPPLNNVLGRTAGTADGFKYSKQMFEAGEGGLIWSQESLAAFLRDPKAMVKGTKMSFAGLKKDQDVADILAYLATFSTTAAEPAAQSAVPATPAQATAQAPSTGPKALAVDTVVPAHGVLHLGRPATQDEVAAWDIDVRPDGLGLPEGRGTVAQGEGIFTERCASCHGDFGEAVGRWPVLAGGQDSLQAERPEKTIGSYWPYLSTVYDYVRRAMPFGDARSLSDDDVYALTAYLLYLNDVVTDEQFELSNENFTSIHLPNEANFIDDDRQQEPHYAQKREPCMENCKAEPAKIIMRARVLDVTPDADEGEGAGAIE